MRRPRFHTSQPLQSGELCLEAEPSRHIGRTLRMRVGDSLCLFDGKGSEAAAQITNVERDAVSVALQEPQLLDRESPLAVTLAIAVSRGDRMETVIQKATELGVAIIRPLLSERTGVRLDEKRWLRKREHWQRIAISACEQCGRNRLPENAAPVPLSTLLREECPEAELRLILHPQGSAAPLPSQCRSLYLLVGPEGGFSDDEVAAAVAAGFSALQLGPRVLRTETAPIAAISLAQARWGDLLAGA